MIDRQTVRTFLLTETFSDVIDLINVRVTGKYWVTSQHLGVETPDGPDVDLLFFGYLWFQQSAGERDVKLFFFLIFFYY